MTSDCRRRYLDSMPNAVFRPDLRRPLEMVVVNSCRLRHISISSGGRRYCGQTQLNSNQDQRPAWRRNFSGNQLFFLQGSVWWEFSRRELDRCGKLVSGYGRLSSQFPFLYGGAHFELRPNQLLGSDERSASQFLAESARRGDVLIVVFCAAFFAVERARGFRTPTAIFY